MNLSNKDYSKLYLLQDRFLEWWKTLGLPFYLTGGTALGRFYLNHRFSEDLDFFINASPDYQQYIAILKSKISSQFNVNIQQSLFADDFTRLFLSENDIFLKIELVNDIAFCAVQPNNYAYGLIDSPLNILSNKLTALIGRDEPKDVFDIIHISLSYSFNWPEVFELTKQKAVINELDIEERLISFPVVWFENLNWLINPLHIETTRQLLKQIADDFLLGKTNSLGVNKIPLKIAKPITLE